MGSPDEANGMFDVLTYQKGGSVLRMLERYLGADVFRDGIRRYLRDARLRQHGDRRPVAGARAGDRANRSATIMDTWILQGGHPLVSRRGDTLSQTPFSYGPPAPGEESAIGSSWHIPVHLRAIGDAGASAGAATEAGPETEDERVRLDGPSMVVRSVPGATTVVNAGGWGVYRVAYAAEEVHRLARRMGALRALERVNLFADTWASVLADEMRLEQFFELAAALGHDEEPGTWRAVVGALDLCDRVVPDGDRPAVAAATTGLLVGRAGELGWDARPGDTERTPSLRSLLLQALGTMGSHAPTIDEADRRFGAAPVAGGTTPIPADIEGAVLTVVARLNRRSDYTAMLERYRHPDTPQEEQRYLHALAQFPDVDRALETFELALDEVRSQDAPYLVADLLRNRVTGPAVWARVAEEWDRLLKRIPANSDSRMVAAVRLLCGDPALAASIGVFLAGHPVRTGQRTVRQSLERLGVNVDFAARQRDGLAATLSALRR